MSGKKAKGKRGKTRKKLKRKGPKPTISEFLKKPKPGERVVIDIDSSVHSGLPEVRFQGKSGRVKGVKNHSVKVSLVDSGKRKTIQVHPVHLTVLGGESK